LARVGAWLWHCADSRHSKKGHEGLGLYALRREQVAEVLAACREADALVRVIVAALDAAGLGEMMRESTGIVEGVGMPQVCVTIAVDGARQLAQIMNILPELLPPEAHRPP
jgi:hypothetical protein